MPTLAAKFVHTFTLLLTVSNNEGMAAGDISISPTGQSSAYLVIHAVLLVAVLILAILASKNVKKQGDQARRGFPWFVASLWLYSL